MLVALLRSAVLCSSEKYKHAATFSVWIVKNIASYSCMQHSSIYIEYVYINKWLRCPFYCFNFVKNFNMDTRKNEHLNYPKTKNSMHFLMWKRRCLSFEFENFTDKWFFFAFAFAFAFCITVIRWVRLRGLFSFAWFMKCCNHQSAIFITIGQLAAH